MCSTCPGSRSFCAGCTPASCRSWRWRPSERRRSPARCCSTTWPPTCTRATRPTRNGGGGRWRSSRGCWARPSAEGGWALSLDRELLRELLGQEELRDLIDPAALADVEADLQRASDRTRAANVD